ncbi:hypothetical protein BDZ89DRAFT_1139528 [Hymenopellis radicata]|nr:hypothetical protein BDZ89DRAFT_1139528 [Hymenopellis radicata]
MSETRTAASTALSYILSLTPLWTPNTLEDDESDVHMSLPEPEYTNFSVQDLITQGKLLLASSGKEFQRPSGILSSAAEVKKARKEAMGRLGLDFLDKVADEIDLDKELADEGWGHRNGNPPTGGKTENLALPSPMDVCVPSTNSGGDSRSGSRKRKPGTSAFVTAPPPQATGAKYVAAPAPAGKSHKANNSSRLGSPAAPSSDKVVVDPSKGGAVAAKEVKQSRALEVKSGFRIWDGVVKILEVNLLRPAWEVRHGAAMALRGLLKIQGQYGGMQVDAAWSENEIAHEKWCNDLSAKFLCVFVLDRFRDFVSDQVIAPIREMVSQTLASLLIHMPRRSIIHVHRILLQMIQQDFTIPSSIESKSRTRSKKSTDQKVHIWEVRHAGLLGIKYEVAVRGDLFTGHVVKQEDSDFDDSAKEILRGVVAAALLGLSDPDDDVRVVAASCLLPVAVHLVGHLPESLEQVLPVLWQCLSDIKDDLNSSVGAVMDLLGKLVVFDKVISLLGVVTLHSFIAVESLPRDWIDTAFLRLLFQNLIVEERPDIRDATLQTWRMGRRSCDGNVLSQDLALISLEITLKARVAATALAHLITFWPGEIVTSDSLFQPILTHYIESSSILQKFLGAVVAEEWAHDYERMSPSGPPLDEKSALAKEVSVKTLAWLQGPAPVMTDCKLPMSSIPFLGTEIDVTGTNPEAFTIETAQAACGPMFTRPKESLGRTKKRELAAISEKRVAIMANIDRYNEVKAQHDTRVSAAFAAAFVAFRVRLTMSFTLSRGIKNEENLGLQTRSAPPDKIVKNLCTFLCQDTGSSKNGKDSKDKDKDVSAPVLEDPKVQLSRRGVGLAFNELFQSPEDCDKLIEKQFGQDVIDSLSVLEAVVPTLHEDVWPGLPMLYTGNARERQRLLSKVSSCDVIIISYEVVRNDISNLEGINWLYCILDEGHDIKNAKNEADQSRQVHPRAASCSLVRNANPVMMSEVRSVVEQAGAAFFYGRHELSPWRGGESAGGKERIDF